MIYSYRRVSTEEQVNGPQAQEDAILKWLEAHDDVYENAKNMHVDFFDDGVSGSVPFNERPAGAALANALKEGDTIVVSKLDRLFRSVADAANMIGMWNSANIKLVSISEGFDMGNPYGRAMAQMASVFAELEREMIRARTKEALDAKRARGECVGTVPYGYDRVGNMMVNNDAEQARIEKIMSMRVQGGLEAREIADTLNLHGIKAKNGGLWHKTQVQRVIAREILKTTQRCLHVT